MVLHLHESFIHVEQRQRSSYESELHYSRIYPHSFGYLNNCTYQSQTIHLRNIE